jgi:hypothetical protein
MKAQKNPNAWSCLPTAFAIALDVEVENMIAQIGHDGSEITHAGLPDPLRRRGFHPQECIEVCMRDNIAVTQIDMTPSAVPSDQYRQSGAQEKIFSTISGESARVRFERHMFGSHGVIDCRTKFGLGHALAYRGHGDHAEIADPATGEIFTYQFWADAEGKGLFLVSLYRFDLIT